MRAYAILRKTGKNVDAKYEHTHTQRQVKPIADRVKTIVRIGLHAVITRQGYRLTDIGNTV